MKNLISILILMSASLANAEGGISSGTEPFPRGEMHVSAIADVSIRRVTGGCFNCLGQITMSFRVASGGPCHRYIPRVDWASNNAATITIEDYFDSQCGKPEQPNAKVQISLGTAQGLPPAGSSISIKNPVLIDEIQAP